MRRGAMGTMASNNLACINSFFTPQNCKTAARHTGVASFKDNLIEFIINCGKAAAAVSLVSCWLRLVTICRIPQRKHKDKDWSRHIVCDESDKWESIYFSRSSSSSCKYINRAARLGGSNAHRLAGSSMQKHRRSRYKTAQNSPEVLKGGN